MIMCYGQTYSNYEIVENAKIRNKKTGHVLKYTYKGNKMYPYVNMKSDEGEIHSIQVRYLLQDNQYYNYGSFINHEYIGWKYKCMITKFGLLEFI